MFEAILSFIVMYKYILIFYLFIILFIVLHRKKIDVQGKIIFLYRTKLGIAWMDKYSTKYREWVILSGYIGIGVGFIGMLFISFFLIKNIYDLIMVPQAASGVSLVLPGINVPGLGILPFWHWLVAIFVIAVVHEFSHGIVARAHNVEVKNTGVVFFGPIIGAFVEPNEKKMGKEKDTVQYSILAAGAFSNIILAMVAFLLLTFVLNPIQAEITETKGFTFESYYNMSYPFAVAGIAVGTVITGIDGKQTTNFQEFSEGLVNKKPGDSVVVEAGGKTYTLTLAANPEQPEKGFLGIMGIKNEVVAKPAFQAGIGIVGYYAVDVGATFLRWLFLLSFGIGLFNLLPLPIVDGGRMVQTFMHKLKGAENGEKRYRQIGMFFLLLLVVSLVLPYLLKWMVV